MVKEHVLVGADVSARGSKGRSEGKGTRRWVTVFAGIFLSMGFIAALLGDADIIGKIYFGIALGIASVPVFREALEHVRENLFNADLLMAIAAVGAALISVWEEGALVLLLYDVAESVEDYTVDKVRHIAAKMANLLPKRALVKRGAGLEEVPVDSLQVGDVVVVKPGWRIPVDGTVVAGFSNVDVSTITGEPLPAAKNPGDDVLSGTLNLEGALEVQAKKSFNDSTVNRIVRLVMEARERKTHIERVVDRFARRYTPSMLLLATIIAVIPPVVFGGNFFTWVYRALIILIIACPSAFVIATPVTVLMGLTRAMWSGVLVKGGIYLEEIARARTVVFDKTGTLTLGQLKVAEILPENGYTREYVLWAAALAEVQSSHPISQAIMDAATAAGISPTEDIELVEVPGKGIIASLNTGQTIVVGNPTFLAERGHSIPLVLADGRSRAQGTVVAVAVDGNVIGTIMLADEIRSEAKPTIEALTSLGVDHVEMLTGDVESTAAQVAGQLGIMHYFSGLLPEQKLARVHQMMKQYGSVVMVGDGTNDAPVLAASSVGIAVGTAGSDIAIEAADIALVSSDLTAVPYTFKLGQKVTRKLKVNIIITLAFKFLVILLGILGLVPLWFAVVGDDGITLIIIANALPLLRFRKPLEQQGLQDPSDLTHARTEDRVPRCNSRVHPKT
ncbi:MAG TPA: cation-translocating P-type ATPase [Candidatus Lokiarchaeia archaeon]|nr:cation-translocating P-type ATPase [Candidatus Lokiarchaeia archaeon]